MAEKLILPGAVDLHVHLREPSTNKSETIASGTTAALEGGYVFVADMPNNPGAGMATWSRAHLDEKIGIANKSAEIPVGFYAGSQPESDNVRELAAMAKRAIGLKLYGDPTTGNDNTYEAEDFRETIREWHRVAPDKPIMFHAGGNNLGDMINLVAVEYSHHLHVCHVNSVEQVQLVGRAKDEGFKVTCGVCPHHLLMTSHNVVTHGAFAEMKPPLARQDEAEELMALLDFGDIDVIESDFAPHSVEAKLEAENENGHCYGVPGIEHILPLLFYQVKKGRLSDKRMIEATHTKPAEILGVKHGPDTSVTWGFRRGVYIIDEESIRAGCGWSPYIGMLALGEVSDVKVGGRMLDGTKMPAKRAVWERGTVI